MLLIVLERHVSAGSKPAKLVAMFQNSRVLVETPLQLKCKPATLNCLFLLENLAMLI